MAKRHAENINGEWVEKTPRQFRAEHNASIPDGRLAEHGLHEVTVDPKPDAPGQIVEPGPIVDRDGLPVRTWITRDPTPEEVEEARARLHAAAHSAYSRAMAPISTGYPAEEREGWAEQVAAAQEVLSGGQNDLIDALRAPTGETATEMANTIITKRQQYLVAYGQVTAARRGLAAQIEAATTLADLDAIDVNAAFGLG